MIFFFIKIFSNYTEQQSIDHKLKLRIKICPSLYNLTGTQNTDNVQQMLHLYELGPLCNK